MPSLGDKGIFNWFDAAYSFKPPGLTRRRRIRSSDTLFMSAGDTPSQQAFNSSECLPVKLAPTRRHSAVGLIWPRK
jgi:hypothetical protein